MPDRWKILILLFVARTGLGFQFQVLGSVGPQLTEQLQFSHAAVGTLIGLFLLAGIVLSFPAGFASRLVPDKWLVTGGLLLLAIGGAISASGETYLLLAMGRVLSGAGFVFGTLYFAKMIGDWFAGKELATAMGVLVMSWPVGIALGQLVFPWVAIGYGFNTAFHISAIYCLLAAALVALCYRDPAQAESGESATPASAASGFTRLHWKLTLVAAIVWGLFNAGYFVYLSYSARALMMAGLSVSHAAVLSSIPSWIMIFSAIAAGQLVDRIGRRDLVLNCSMLAAVVSLMLLGTSSAIYVAIFLFGTLGMASAGIIMALTGESMPAESRAFGMGIFFTIYFLLGLPAPAIAGWLYDLTGTPSASMVFAALLFALVAVMNAVFRWMQKQQAI